MVRVVGIAALFLLAACATASAPAPGGPAEAAVQTPRIEYDYDILIRGGTIYDGSGGKPFVADIGVKDGQINAVYPKLKGDGTVEINARGKAVAPGFIGAGDLQAGFVGAAGRCDYVAGSEPLSESIRQLTSERAERLGLKQQGRIMPGWSADIVVFDPRGGLPRPDAVDDVIIQGVMAVDHGRLTGRAAAAVYEGCG